LKTYEYLKNKIEKEGCIHLTLIDPAFDSEKNIKIIKEAESAGTSGIMVGGSYNTIETDETIKKIKSSTNLPVIIFPGNVHDVSKNADAIFFLSMLNSRNTYYISQVQALSSCMIKRAGIEPISIAYVVFEPGMTVGFVGDANLIRRQKPEIAVGYALSAEFTGYKFVYFEAGSGADAPIPIEAVELMRKACKIHLIVGGGIKNAETAEKYSKAGANIIITGTMGEQIDNFSSELKKLINAIKR